MSFVALSASYKEDYLKRQELICRICSFMKHHPEPWLRQDQIIKVLRLIRSCARDFTLPRTFVRQVHAYIAQRMFWSRFPDSQCVALLLNLQFRNDCYLSLLLPGADPAVQRQAHHQFVEYFLAHAYRRRLLFNGYRLPCVEVFDGTSWQHPVQYAATACDLPLLRVLVRYGAVLSYDVNYEDRSLRRRPYGWEGLLLLMWMLTSSVDLNPDLLPYQDLTLQPDDRERYRCLLTACSMIVPDLPRWSPSFLKSVYYRGKYLRHQDEAAAFVRNFSARVLPGLDQHFTAPPDLLSECRKVIRRCLNERWQLPGGIGHLPIPASLKEYLDVRFQ